jgi:hypothetical protein
LDMTEHYLLFKGKASLPPSPASKAFVYGRI